MYGVPGNSKHFPKGEKVRGPGTGTSDSIKAAIPAGSYIMPADSTEQLGFGVPRAGASQVPVNVSNGETAIPPEQVHAFGVRALNEMKNATHKPTGQPSAAGGELFFADGGLVEDPLKKWTPEQRAQKQAQLAQQTEQLRLAKAGAPGGVPGNPARAAAMQAQYDQPVTGPRQPKPVSTQPVAAGVNLRSGEQPSVANDVADGLAGAGKVAVGVAGYPVLAAYDGVRNAAGSLAGGDTSQIEQYRGGARNLISEGAEQVSTASANLRERTATATRDALGIDQAPAVGVPRAKASAPAVPSAPAAGPAAAAEQAAPTAAGQNVTEPGPGVGWVRTGNGVGAAGGEIAMRRNEQGQVEFTNETASPEAVAGAKAMPAGGFGVPRRGAESEDLVGRGSAANVGNGVGTFSQMEAGSSAEALARFERANKIRGEQIAEDGGLKVAGIRDSSRMPTAAELVNNRLERQDTRDQLDAARTNQDAQLTASRVATEGMQQQKLQQEIEAGQYSVQDRQRIAALQAQMTDPNLSLEERLAAQQAYTSLTTQAKDRFKSQDVILGRDDTGKDIRGTQLIDVTTGQPVAGAVGSSQRRAAVTMAEVEQTAKARGISSDEVIQRLQSAGVAVSG